MALAVSCNLCASRRHQGFYLRGIMGVGYMAATGSGPSGSASVSGLATYGGVAIGGETAPGLSVAGLLLGSTTTNEFHGGPFANATIAGSVPSPSQSGPSATPPRASINAQAALAELGVLVDWFPNPAEGWHAGVTVGLGVVGVTNNADGSALGGVSFAGSVFGGYDFWIGKSWSLGLALTAGGATSATLNDTGGKDSGYRLAPLTIGVMTSILYY